MGKESYAIIFGKGVVRYFVGLGLTIGIIYSIFTVGYVFNGPYVTREFAPQFNASAEEVRHVLIKASVLRDYPCPAGAWCLGEKLSWRGERGGMKVMTYGISDPAVLAEITKIFSRTFAATPSMDHLMYIAYSNELRSSPTSRTRLPKVELFTVEMRR
jgi:hypothetical protein